MWKIIRKAGNTYEVSKTGDIRNSKTGKLLKQNIASGYKGVTIRPNGRKSKAVRLRTHRCVAEAFIENYFEGAVVNHKDGNKLNNNVENLEWCSHSENTIHAYNTGLKIAIMGEKHPRAILTELDVLCINLLYIPKYFGKRKIAKILDLPSSLVDSVTSGKSWKIK